MEDVRYSEDVKDAIHLAGKLAKKQGQAPISDRVYLLGLLMTHRKFNRLDSLLQELGISPGKAAQRLKNNLKTPTPAPTSDWLKNAELMAQAARPNAGKPALMEVEHLLKAFCLSPDPVVSAIMQENRVSAERVDQAMAQAHRKQGRNTLLFLGKELLEVIVFVLFFLILIKSFLGELRLIPSESMVPGLQVNDRLVIERVTRLNRPYQRGDVLVFYPPMSQLKKDPWSLFLRWTGFSGLIYKKDDYIDVAYIKRLIGLPGDMVEVRPGDGVYVNSKKLDEPYVNEVSETCTLVKPEPYCGAVKVPDGQYYMMGDNRNQSLDSRYWGFARKERVIGRAVFRIWPLDRIGALPKPAY
ncbi:signal peptidase I [Vampirovibrio sp.]|uniref:signal peptidase I n=1 Tax=Vampirovibrio sp. TaxID=2717857 RepID=UPI0035937EC7